MVHFTKKFASFSIFLMAMAMIFTNAGTASAQTTTARYMEKLDRGLIAVKSGSGYFLSWRLFGTDPQDATFGFNVYKGTTKLNALRSSPTPRAIRTTAPAPGPIR